MGGREGDGRAGWRRGEVGEGGELKQPFGLKQQCCALSIGHRLVESAREAKTAVRSSLVPHAVLLMLSRAMNAPWWFESIGKKPSVKADLAIYDKVLGVSG